MTQRIQRVADSDREHRRAVRLVVEVGVERFDFRAPTHSGTDERGGEDVTYETFGDQVAYESDWRCRTRLQPDDGEYILFPGQRRQGLGFGQAVAERPFAVHGLAGFERGGCQFEV